MERFEQWREADREAHEAELWVRSFGRRSNYELVPRAEVEHARELRARADALFGEAMREMSDQVRRAVQKVRERPAA